MSRCIDKFKLIDRIVASPAFPNFGMDGCFLRDCVVNLILKMPTIDAEVKHGEWEDFEIPHMIRCSECGVSDLAIHRTYFKYCPYCGARMDGDEDD